MNSNALSKWETWQIVFVVAHFVIAGMVAYYETSSSAVDDPIALKFAASGLLYGIGLLPK